MGVYSTAKVSVDGKTRAYLKKCIYRKESYREGTLTILTLLITDILKLKLKLN